MAPVQPEDISDNELGADSGSGQESRLRAQNAANRLNLILQRHGVTGEQREYHTENSGDSESTEDDDLSVSEPESQGVEDNEAEASADDAPLLPAELLKPLPSPAYSPQQAISVPWNQMTRKQKRAQRTRSIQAKKKEWDRLRQETKGTGVLETGRVAQLKRGIVAKSDKVRSGRVAKKAKPPASGRQQLLEQRKRVGQQSGRGDLRPMKRAKTKSDG